MDDEKASYSKDPRIPCQYGHKCYQKNPTHHNKYKHPSDPKRKKIFSNQGNCLKKIKPNSPTSNPKRNKPVSSDSEDPTSRVNENGGGKERPEDKFSNDVSNSDSDEELHENSGDMEKPKVKISNDVSESESEEESKNDSSENDIGKKKANASISNDMSDSESDVEPSTTKDDLSSTSSKNLQIKEKNQCILTPSVCDHKNGHNNEISKRFLKDKFKFDMPEDFYKFFEFCDRLNKQNPGKALSSIGLELVGPFDVLCGKFCGMQKKDEEYLIHWRYFYDPPQLQTVLKGDDKTGYHIGYFRDTPEKPPVFMVENHGMKDGVLTVVGENIFAAVSLYLEDKIKTANPFSKLNFNKIAKLVKEEAEKLGMDLSRKTKNMKKRDDKILTRTFNKIGLIVPYERKTQLGYRKLAMSDKQLEALLTNIQKASSEQKQKLLGDLQAELLTWTDIACDECDFGTGIELGWDIISHGVEDLNHTAARFLSSNFLQLKWNAFAKIAEAHMANRKKSCDLSIL